MPLNKLNHLFYSKILLFGEYSLLYDSNGLSIPYSHFNGRLTFINNEGYTDLEYAKQSNNQLKQYCEFIEENYTNYIDINSLKRDLDKGLFFESTIPEGYGLGSSGALVASIYYTYGKNKIGSKTGLSKEKTQKLKKIFSGLESYFHGKSSGIDPLICYISHPLFIKNQNDISSIGISRKNIEKDDAIFIINTKKTGKTAPLVDLFLKKCLSEDYLDKIKNHLIPTTNHCVKSLLKGDLPSFYRDLKELSKFQLKYLKEMIPSEFVKYWEEGLEKNDYILKLCGSGGGGYLLGFTRNYNKVKNNLLEEGLEIITVYQE